MTNILLLLASFFSAITALSIKYSLSSSNPYYLLVTILSEIGLISSYYYLLDKSDILSQFALVKIISVLIIIIPSMILFGVKLTKTKLIGLLLSFIAIYLLHN